MILDWEIYFAEKNISGPAFWGKKLKSIVYQILRFRHKNRSDIQGHIETLGRQAQRIKDKGSEAYRDTVNEIARLKGVLEKM